MDIELMQSFNEPQRAAIEYCDGASLVVAGAGSYRHQRGCGWRDPQRGQGVRVGAGERH